MNPIDLVVLTAMDFDHPFCLLLSPHIDDAAWELALDGQYSIWAVPA